MARKIAMMGVTKLLVVCIQLKRCSQSWLYLLQDVRKDMQCVQQGQEHITAYQKVGFVMEDLTVISL